MASENLWGTIPTADDTESPSSILREQARILTEQTRNHLQGRVEIGRDVYGLMTELSIRAPYLSNYEIALVRAAHEAIMYPVELYNLLESPNEPMACKDANDFKRSLSQILQSSKVKGVISSLLAQSKEEESAVSI